MSTNITIKEAAITLNISEQRVRTLCRTGILPATKFGRSWMIGKDSLNHYGLQSAHMVAVSVLFSRITPHKLGQGTNPNESGPSKIMVVTITLSKFSV
jgi:excisionase family DNA binding protein